MKNRTTTGWFKPKGKKLSFMEVMVCLENDCGHIWEASNMSSPCPKCASGSVIPLSTLDPENKGILRLGKVNSYG